MIEIICKDDSEKTNQNKEEETVFLPKNIRQVGSPRGRHRIYLEDYVYTYLRSVAKDNEKCAAVFLGKSTVVKDIRYTFVSGVIECGAAVFQWENICLDDSFWDYIYKEQKQFFSDMEIVGWVLGKAGQAMELTPAVEAAHRKYFAGRDKVLMLLDILEGEELFFVYEQGYLQKREGYYIYYEKNLAMQSYMIYKREEEMRLNELKCSDSAKEDIEQELEKIFESEDGQAQESMIQMQEWQDAKPMAKEQKTQAEEALETYRKMLLERQGKQEARKNRRFLYTASSFFLVVLCVIGITTINNYRKMQEVEDVLNIMKHTENEPSSSENADLEKNVKSEDEHLVVETVESQIEPIEESSDENGVGSKESKLPEDRAKQDAADGERETSTAADESDNENSTDSEKQDKKKAGDEKKSENKKKSDDEKKVQEKEEPNNADENDAKKEPEESSEEKALAIEQDGDKRYYTVQAGDTLLSICLNVYQNKNMVQTLKEVNGIEDGDRILVGQRLLLP